MKLNTRKILGVVILIGCIQLLQAQSTIPFDANVKTGRLSNGFTYYIRNNKQPANRVVFYLVNKVGSILESDDQRGLAHFLEHMAFNGTRHFPKNEMVNYLQKAGVRFGADLNATTGFDQTVYQLPVPAGNKELLKNTFSILRDWAQGLLLDSIEINKERGVVLEEKRQRLGASQRIWEQTQPVLLNQSRYVHRLPIGTEEVLKNFKHETLRDFYHKWYRPELQALVVVGDINELQIEKMIIAHFSDLKNPDNKPEWRKYNIPLLNKNQYLVVTDPEATVFNIGIYIKHVSAEMRTQQDFRQSMLRSILNDIINTRFNEAGRQQETPFISMNGSIGNLLAALDGLVLNVQPKPGETEKAFKALWTEVERIKRFGFLNTELATAKLNFISRFEAAFKERNNTASDSYAREYTRHFTNGEAAPGIAYEYEFYKKDIDQVSIEDLGKLFGQLLQPVNRDLIITANEKDKASVPTEETLIGWMKEIENSSVTAYIDKPVDKELIAVLPKPGSIIYEKKLFEKAGITEFKLSNGVRVLLKPSDFKNDDILFSATSPGGLSMVSDSDFWTLRFAPEMVAASGAGNFNPGALKKLLSGKLVSVSPFISVYHEGFNGRSSAGDLETALQLVHLFFTRPRFDPVQLQLLKQRYRISYENSKDLPATVFSDTIAGISSGHHFRSMRPIPEQIDAIQADKLLALYKERFSNAGDFTFVFTGSFEIEKIKPLLALYLGSLPSTGKSETPIDVKQNIANGLHSSKITGGKEPQAQVVLMLSGECTADAGTRLQISVLTGILTQRLIVKLREEMGGLYNININPTFRTKPTGEYSVQTRFTCAPENVEQLIIGTLSEIGKIKTEGVLPEEINKIKAASGIQKQHLLKENSFWHSLMINSVQDETEDQIEAVFDDKPWKQITPESIQAAAIKYLRLENYMRFVLLPEK